MILFGPCMLAAPLVAVIAILALPLWPVAIVVLGVLRILWWPVERVATALDQAWAREWSATLARWYQAVLKPWVYFEQRRPPRN
ncbi:MAG: hypothetical protein ABIZ91_05930 [Gemmatimonadaceae bacterium]